MLTAFPLVQNVIISHLDYFISLLPSLSNLHITVTVVFLKYNSSNCLNLLLKILQWTTHYEVKLLRMAFRVLHNLALC